MHLHLYPYFVNNCIFTHIPKQDKKKPKLFPRTRRIHLHVHAFHGKSNSRPTKRAQTKRSFRANERKTQNPEKSRRSCRNPVDNPSDLFISTTSYRPFIIVSILRVIFRIIFDSQ